MNRTYILFILINFGATVNAETSESLVEKQNTMAEFKTTVAAFLTNKTEPGLQEKLKYLYEKIKNFDIAPDVKNKIANFMDQIFSTQTPTPATSQTPISTPTPSPTSTPPTKTTPSVGAVSAEFNQALASIKQAVVEKTTTASTILQEQAEQLCTKLQVINLKEAGQEVFTKAGEAQQACAQLHEKLKTQSAELVGKQLKAMGEGITAAKEKLSSTSQEISSAAKEQMKILCTTIDQGVQHLADTAKQGVVPWLAKQAESIKDGVKDICVPTLASAQKTESHQTGQPTQQTTKISTSKTAVQVVEKKVEPKKVVIKELKVTEPKQDIPVQIKVEAPKSSTNPFEQPQTSSPASSSTPNLFTTTNNPFLTEPQLTQVEKAVARPQKPLEQKTTTIKIAERAIEKPSQETQKATEKIKEKENIYLVVNTRILLLLNTINSEYTTISIAQNDSQSKYVDIKAHVKEILEIKKQMAILTEQESNALKGLITECMSELMSNLKKQGSQVITLVQKPLEDRINYLVLWLGVSANVACATKPKSSAEQPIDWWQKAIKGIQESAQELKTKTEMVLCLDDEMIYAQKDKQYQAVTNKIHVDKMIQELGTFLPYIKKGIAEPFTLISDPELKDWISDNHLKNVKMIINSLLSITESIQENINKEIKTPKETFYKNNGQLIILYNLWVRFLAMYIEPKKLTSDESTVLSLFKKDYFTPLHTIVTELNNSRIKIDEKATKKLLKLGKDYAKE